MRTLYDILEWNVQAWVVIKVKYRYMVLYGHVQNIYNMKLVLKFLNRNTCRYKHMYITL